MNNRAATWAGFFAEEPVKNPTEYRIVPISVYLADSFLQFKSTEIVRHGFLWRKKKTVECWRFIYTKIWCTVHGWGLSEMGCTATLPAATSSVLNSFHGQEGPSLILFTKQYPNINAYFLKMRKLRAEYLIEQEEKSKAQITYL